MNSGNQAAGRKGPAHALGTDFLDDLFRNSLDPGYADAAARRRQLGPPGQWERITGQALRAVALFVVGFLLAVAYLQTVAEEPERSKVRATLAEQIKQRQARTDELALEAEQLRDEVARLRGAVLSSGDAARLREQEAAVGLARVRGDGVIVEVADAPPDPNATEDEAKLSRVLDRDLQHIVNALWSAGAEAIAINGQRLTSTSTIRAAGNAILVDFRPVVGPYTVAAIGPAEMEKRFQASATARLMRRLVDDYGMEFRVKAVEDLTLPAAGDPQLRHAQPPMTPAPTDSGRSTTPSGGGR
jgi:uncharacterized protein YlxW (UPF0749 family)